MLLILRKIRQEYLGKGRIQKYLLYSISELVLIVLGILVALYFNNWNETRKAQDLEIEVLKGIQQDLNANISSFEQRIATDAEVVANCDTLIEIMRDEGSTYKQEMNLLFGRINDWSPVHPSRLAYSNLQSIGIAIITNDSLRSKIIHLFDQTYLLHEDIEQVMFELYTKGSNISLKYLETGDNFAHKTPNDFQQLKKEAEFINYLTFARSERKQTMQVLQNYIQPLTMGLRDEIRHEIVRLEK